jgi:hypothetical protein
MNKTMRRENENTLIGLLADDGREDNHSNTESRSSPMYAMKGKKEKERNVVCLHDQLLRGRERTEEKDRETSTK